MFSQVTSFSSKGLSSACVTGGLVNDDVKQMVAKGMFSLLFFTPELLITNSRWRKLLTNNIYSRCLKAFVIDEAHCIKKW